MRVILVPNDGSIKNEQANLEKQNLYDWNNFVDNNNGSCFTVENLQFIAEQINSKYFKNNYKSKYNKDKYIYIKTSNTKKGLLKDLIRFFKDKYSCDNQLCWLKTPFLQSHGNSEILENTFRPKINKTVAAKVVSKA